MSLGREIKKARIDKGWKQQDLQVATGLSQKYLSAVELDKAQPSFEVVKRIARVLEMSLDRLVYEEDVPPAPPKSSRKTRTSTSDAGQAAPSTVKRTRASKAAPRA
jgi:transcriptional regulator with XRE-family HTH domain